MAGDVLVTDELVWPIETFSYLWVEEFLVAWARSPKAGAAVREVRDSGVRILDLEVFPVVYRDEVYGLLRDELVPEVRRVGRHVTHYARLADMAGKALARYQGRPIRNHTLTLTPTITWRTARAMFNLTKNFLTNHSTDTEARNLLEPLRKGFGARDLDLSVLSDAAQRSTLEFLRDGLLPANDRVMPLGPVDKEWTAAWLQEVVDLADTALRGHAPS